MTGISYMKMDLSHLLVTLTLFSTGLQAAEWGYWGKNGPENWPGICTTGKKQSPIDISTKDAIKINFGPVNFGRYDMSFYATVKNNGHTVEIKLHGVPPYISGANLQSAYIFEQMHFHWGAEHTVDGLRGPLELHLVHYDKQYANVSIAAQHENGIVVVSVLFELSKHDNPQLKSIVKATREVSYKVGKSTTIQAKLIPSKLLPKDRAYYYYQGSLTTPACEESVLWFVLMKRCTVSTAQINVFKRLIGDHGRLTFNNRPTQELNGRKVYHYYLERFMRQ
ncbi:Carbonic anhydrase 3 isoform X1 [Camponotus japonicus]